MFFSCQLVFAADDGDWWLQRQIQIGDGKNQYGKNVYGKAARSVIEDVPLKDGTGSRVEQLIKRSIAVDKPTPTKVGTPMLKRISHVAKTPGVQMVGAYAVIQLLEAIGWVMKDGTYVKRIENNNGFECSVDNVQFSTQCNSIISADLKTNASLTAAQVKKYKEITAASPDRSHAFGLEEFSCSPRNIGYCTNDGLVRGSIYVRASKKESIEVPITPVLLGAAMLGKDYKDPDPNFDNDRVNTGDYTSVKEVYEHDPSGVGNELAKDMDQKLKNAKPTDTPSYVGDPKYDSQPLIDDNSSDRAWNEKGGEATGGTEQEKDPETGEPTGNQSITIQFPLFCSWASSMCKWYDDWTKFTTEKPELEDESLEVEDKEIIAYQREDYIQFGQSCPFSPQIKSLPLGVLGTLEFETDLTFICTFGYQARPYVLGLGHLGALIFLLIGLRNGNA